MIQYNRNTVNGRVKSLCLFCCFATEWFSVRDTKRKKQGGEKADTKNAMDFDKTLPFQTTRLKKEDSSIRKKVSIFSLTDNHPSLFWKKLPKKIFLPLSLSFLCLSSIRRVKQSGGWRDGEREQKSLLNLRQYLTGYEMRESEVVSPQHCPNSKSTPGDDKK